MYEGAPQPVATAPSIAAPAVGLQGRSLLAGVNALYRAYETRRPPAERVLEDPFADPFVERDWRIQLIRHARHVIPPLWRVVEQLQTVHCIRHRAVDALLLQRLASGARQVLVVGAGYDTRPLRLADALDGVRWFELDHPGTQRSKLEKLGGDPRWGAKVAAAGIDLMTGSVGATLAALGVPRDAPTCVIVEGVLHYLSAARAAAVLRELADHFEDAHLVLSFIRSEVYARASGTLIRLIKTVREVPQLHFTPDELATFAGRCGWSLAQRWTVDEQIEAFAPQARARLRGPSQDVALLRRVPPA